MRRPPQPSATPPRPDFGAEGEAWFQAFMDHSPMLAFLKDAEGRLVYVNAPFERVFRVTLAELAGKTDFEYLPEPVARQNRDNDRLVMTTGRMLETVEVVPTPDGAERRWLVVKFPVVDRVGRRLLGGTALDITEREATKEEARRQQRRIDGLFRTAAVGMAILDRDLRHVRVNPTLAAFNGLPAEAHVGLGVAETAGPSAPHIARLLGEVVRTGQPVGGVEITVPAGSRARAGHYLASYAPILDEAGAADGVGVLVVDLTEQRSLEDQLRQAQKMEAVGRLAGGIAHDFNNVLTAVRGSCELLRGDLPAESPAQAELKVIADAVDRAARLTGQLLAFSRRQPMTLREMDLNEVLAAMQPLVERLSVGGAVRVEVRPEAEDATVHADPVQVEQVVLNLAVNARDAMPEGGTLTLRTRDASLAEELWHRHGLVPAGRYVAVAVEDTGRGIEPAVFERLFEPFFTTKPPGVGTGLGLATVHGIVKQLAGHVVATSVPGRGSTFTVYLPRPERRRQPRPVVRREMPALQGTETVLVVDDEEAVRRSLERLLRRQGYTVLVAGSAEEALELFARHGDAIQLLVTDLLMPGLGGKALAEELRVRRPALPLVYVSGHVDESLPPGPGRRFVRKPFTLTELCEAIRVALDDADACTLEPGP